MKKLLFLLLLLPISVIAQVPEPLQNTYVNDFASLLNAEQIHNLNEKILSIEKKSSVQIAVILINDLPANMQIEQYALEVGRKWHVGNAKNGLVYVAAINQHKQRLEVAGNLEGDIPDITVLEITDNIKPFFRNNDYYGGINELLDGINKHVDPVIKEQLKLAASEHQKSIENLKQSVYTFFTWLLGVALLLVTLWFVFLKNYFKSKREKKKALEQEIKQADYSMPLAGAVSGYIAGRHVRITESNDSYTPPQTYNNYNWENSSSRDNSSSNSSSDSSNYGSWGSGSSDSDSSSGYSGGGSSNDW